MRRTLLTPAGMLAAASALVCLSAAGDARPETQANAPAAEAAVPAPDASEPAAPEPPPRLVGNPANGATKSMVCGGCHGPDGNAPVPMFPKLAGQRSDYVAKQLHDFKSGQRVDPVMAGMAAMLSDQDIADVAAHFESIAVNPGTSDPALAELGERVYRMGRTEIGLLPCIGCHGPSGEGANGAIDGGFPAIGGQNPDYLVKQLQSFRAGSRANDWKGIMQVIASRLSDEDIAALAAYVISLPKESE